MAALWAPLAAAGLFLGAVAHAEPPPDVPAPDPKQACEAPDFGGLYTATTSPDGVVHGVCQYIVEGYFYYDGYDDGAYTGTLVYKNGAKVPTERPQMPSTLNDMNMPGGDLPIIPFPGQF